jgi:hypothetical protein
MIADVKDAFVEVARLIEHAERTMGRMQALIAKTAAPADLERLLNRFDAAMDAMEQES